MGANRSRQNIARVYVYVKNFSATNGKRPENGDGERADVHTVYHSVHHWRDEQQTVEVGIFRQRRSTPPRMWTTSPLCRSRASSVGTIALDGISNLAAVAVPLDAVTFQFRAPGTSNVLFTQTVGLTVTAGSANGSYTLSNVPPGTYDIAVKTPKNLQVVVGGVVVAASATLPNLTLPGGDATDDNTVDIADFGVLVNAYGGQVGATGTNYLSAADFNCDGIVDIADFGILVNNYGSVGAL